MLALYAHPLQNDPYMLPARPCPAGAGLEPAAAAARLLDALLAQAAALQAAGGSLAPLAAGLGRRLSAAGVLSPPDAQQAIRAYSIAICDMLPKAWMDAGGVVHGESHRLWVMVDERVSWHVCMDIRQLFWREGDMVECCGLQTLRDALAPCACSSVPVAGTPACHVWLLPPECRLLVYPPSLTSAPALPYCMHNHHPLTACLTACRCGFTGLATTIRGHAQHHDQQQQQLDPWCVG